MDLVPLPRRGVLRELTGHCLPHPTRVVLMGLMSLAVMHTPFGIRHCNTTASAESGDVKGMA
jgi:hypothetical protein